MEYTVGKDQEDVARLVATEIGQLISKKPDALICLCGGHTPLPVFKQLISDAGSNKFPTDRFKFISLDEWVGLGIEDEGSCKYDLSTHFLNPMGITLGERAHFFNGLNKNLEEECQKAQVFIEQNGGIDLVLLGVGMNGHIGFNEPGSKNTDGIRVVELSDTSKEVGQKYFNQTYDLTHGITLGIGDLLAVERILVMAVGAHKKEIVHQTVNGIESEDFPVTLIRKHQAIHLYVDELAATKLKEVDGC